jgi:hypothetical protein
MSLDFIILTFVVGLVIYKFTDRARPVEKALLDWAARKARPDGNGKADGHAESKASGHAEKEPE